MQSSTEIKHYKILLLLLLLINGTGLFIDILEPDGALYASIAKSIVKQNNWLNLYAYGSDWLDKPHLPFWLSAISFKIFGINAFEYKLPSFLCFIVAIYYTYKLACSFYSKQVAQLATLIFGTSLHVILCNFDVRAEIYLAAFTTAAIFYFNKAQEDKWLKPIVLAAFFSALAIMTKGIFVLIIIGSGFVIYWLFTKQYKEFFKLKWYLFLCLTGIFILPELYALYVQFDLHPEKVVFGRTNVSGLKFFFWDSQFGRFFNTGPIQGSGDIFFFVHTTLWAFLPWSLYLFIIGFKKIKNIKQYKASKTLIVYGSACIGFLMFSISKFQLPHYVVVLFPLFSIITANYLVQIINRVELKFAVIWQNVVFVTLVALIILITVFYKFDYPILVLIITSIVLIFFFFVWKEISLQSIVIKSTLFSLLFAIFFNGFFYPSLMQYQAGMQAGKWQKKNLPNTIIPMYNCNEFSFDFYGNTPIGLENNLPKILQQKTNTFLFTSKQVFNRLNRDSFNVKPIQWFPYFHITELNSEFINKKSRAATLDSFVIINCQKKY